MRNWSVRSGLRLPDRLFVPKIDLHFKIDYADFS